MVRDKSIIIEREIIYDGGVIYSSYKTSHIFKLVL